MLIRNNRKFIVYNSTKFHDTLKNIHYHDTIYLSHIFTDIIRSQRSPRAFFANEINLIKNEKRKKLNDFFTKFRFGITELLMQKSLWFSSLICRASFPF